MPRHAGFRTELTQIFGHMDMSVTIDDPKTYESKWTQPYRYTLLPDTDLLEFICENNPSPMHMVGK